MAALDITPTPLASTRTGPVEIPSPVPELRPNTLVITLPDNRIRVGGGPDGLLIELKPAVDSIKVATLLRWLSTPRDRATFARRARSAGLTQHDAAVILAALTAADKLVTANTEPATPPLRIHVHGHGSVGSALRDMLRPNGFPLTDLLGASLVVLADDLVCEPLLIADLMKLRIPHLPVLVRDGVGVVGPLVLPGLTSCLRCADHHRSMLDPAWPVIATQLIGRPGVASVATTRATAALAHEHIEQLSRGVGDPSSLPGGRPQLENRALELRPTPMRLVERARPTHPLCGCAPAVLP